jgi:hypothetical protein
MLSIYTHVYFAKSQKRIKSVANLFLTTYFFSSFICPQDHGLVTKPTFAAPSQPLEKSLRDRMTAPEARAANRETSPKSTGGGGAKQKGKRTKKKQQQQQESVDRWIQNKF